MPPPSLTPERAKVAEFYSAGSGTIPPLPWQTFPPPFSIVLKTGTTLVREWCGHAHTVLVREDGFEYEGQHYRSLTVIAERITGAHWSGPRFFGLIKRPAASLGAAAGQ